jgi:hypothetical protein
MANMRITVRVGFFALLTAVLSASPVAAQIVPIDIGVPPIDVINPGPDLPPPTVAPSAAGPYYAVPSWDQTLAPNVRFIVLTNMNSQAVLDRETGLVWARANLVATSGGTRFTWNSARASCSSLSLGGRGGWRLPFASELGSLFTLTVSTVPHLPAGHPFILTPLSGPDSDFFFWTNEVLGFDILTYVGTAGFFYDEHLITDPKYGHPAQFGSGFGSMSSYNTLGAWCVRGPSH